MFDMDTQFLPLTLGQQGAAPTGPGEAPLTTNGTTGQDGSPADGTGASGGGSPGLFGPNFLMLMFLVLGAMILFSILGQRREKKKREAMIGAMKKHDKVQTIGGVIGSIVELKPDFVVLKVDESSNTRITFARSAVQQVIKSSDTPAPSESNEPT